MNDQLDIEDAINAEEEKFGEKEYGVSSERLLSVVERIERLETEKADIATDIKEVYAEASGDGFDVKTLREIIRIRKMDADDRASQEALLDTYLSALGMA